MTRHVPLWVQFPEGIIVNNDPIVLPPLRRTNLCQGKDAASNAPAPLASNSSVRCWITLVVVQLPGTCCVSTPETSDGVRIPLYRGQRH